jgi:hypothetical protein
MGLERAAHNPLRFILARNFSRRPDRSRRPPPIGRGHEHSTKGTRVPRRRRSATGKLDDLDYCLRLATTYIELGEAMADRTANYQRVRFEDIQADPNKQLTALADFCQLRFSAAQMIKSAASIRPEPSEAWRQLPADSARELLSQHPIAAQLGYGADAT